MTKARIIRAIVQIISVVLLGMSCREVYFPDDLEQSQPILSVHGILYEYDQPLIKLSWTLGYYDEVEDPVNNAQVIVSDESGRTDTLKEVDQTGLYTIPFNGFPYLSGNEYTLRIETEDGNIFMSNPVKMPTKPVVEKFYAEKAFKTDYIYTSDGKIRTRSIPGISVYTGLVGEVEEDHYYRFRTRAVEQRGYVKPPNTQYEYYQLAKMNDLYDVAKTMPSNNRTWHEDIFLEEPGGPVYDYGYNNPGYSFFMSYFIAHRIYSVSADVYEFYESIEEQLTAENEIFAPVPSRIKSNIFCINNEDARVIGVFEASSFVTLYMSCKTSYGYLSTTLLDSPPGNLPVFVLPEYPALTQ